MMFACLPSIKSAESHTDIFHVVSWNRYILWNLFLQHHFLQVLEHAIPLTDTGNMTFNYTGQPDSKPRVPGLSHESTSRRLLASTLISEFDIAIAFHLPIPVLGLDLVFNHLPEKKGQQFCRVGGYRVLGNSAMVSFRKTVRAMHCLFFLSDSEFPAFRLLNQPALN